MSNIYDVAIIGGGINGCGCAAEASMRGLSVVLFEQDDIAAKTSSSSTKLIHGGLRYLEYYDFSMVKKALDERQILLNLAPHLVRPLPIILPIKKQSRPGWLIRLGLFLYDHLSFNNKLPRSQSLKRKRHSMYFSPLRSTYHKAFLFYDAATDDARLTIANALQAKAHGATINTHSKVLSAKVEQQMWLLTIRNKQGKIDTIQAKSVINAAGPWVLSVQESLNVSVAQKMMLVKGSHILVPALYEGPHAYMLQNDDKRIVFVIPYHGYSMIGTTDQALTTGLEDIHIDDVEINYLLNLANQYFKTHLSKADIAHTWSGARPLLAHKGKKLQALSRDYELHYHSQPAPIVSVYGGKITTYRQLALQAVNHLHPLFPQMHPSMTHCTPLPGGDNLNAFKEQARVQYAWMNQDLLDYYLKQYGTRASLILKGAKSHHDLGIAFTDKLYQAEVDYLMNEEWAHESVDILERRTKQGLHIRPEQKKQLDDYIEYISQTLLSNAN